MTNLATSLLGYTETDLDVAALLVPEPPSTNDDGEYDAWLSAVENRAATIQLLTREHATNDGDEPLLHTLEQLRRRRNEIEQQMIHLVAYMRENVKPRPYTLQQIANAAGLSISGTRTFYDVDDVDALRERIDDVRRRVGEEHARHGSTPGRPTVKIDADRADPTQTLSDDGTLEPIALGSDTEKR